MFRGIRQLFFETFYTILIFTDVLLVLIAQRYMTSFTSSPAQPGLPGGQALHAHRPLSVPPFFDSATGIVAALVTLGVTSATNIFHYCALTLPEDISVK